MSDVIEKVGLFVCAAVLEVRKANLAMDAVMSDLQRLQMGIDPTSESGQQLDRIILSAARFNAQLRLAIAQVPDLSDAQALIAEARAQARPTIEMGELRMADGG